MKVFDVSCKTFIAKGNFGSVYEWDDFTVIKVIQESDLQTQC
jgi:hypothetical protein